MARMVINTGAAPNDGTGDPLRDMGDKLNAMTDELYPLLSRPRFVGGRADSGGGFQTVTPAFTTIAINSSTVDTHNGFNPATGLYTVPITGTYEVNGKCRVLDTSPPRISYGIGVDITNADSAGFFWGSTVDNQAGNGNRNGIFNSRILMLTAGQQLRLFAYCGQNMGITAAELNCYMIG